MTRTGQMDSVPVTQTPASGGVGTRGPVASPRFLPVLGVAEVWTFRFTGLLLWLFAVPGVNAELGPNALLMWVPLAAVGVLVNLQVKRLGERWPDMAEGTPNDTFRLIRDRHPSLDRYTVAAYFQRTRTLSVLLSIFSPPAVARQGGKAR